MVDFLVEGVENEEVGDLVDGEVNLDRTRKSAGRKIGFEGEIVPFRDGAFRKPELPLELLNIELLLHASLSLSYYQ